MIQLDLFDAQRRFEELRSLDGPGWWDRYEALPPAAQPEDCRAVACPKCGAGVGVRCRRPSGHSGSLIGAHAARWDLVLAEAEAQTQPEETDGHTRS